MKRLLARLTTALVLMALAIAPDALAQHHRTFSIHVRASGYDFRWTSPAGESWTCAWADHATCRQRRFEPVAGTWVLHATRALQGPTPDEPVPPSGTAFVLRVPLAGDEAAVSVSWARDHWSVGMARNHDPSVRLVRDRDGCAWSLVNESTRALTVPTHDGVVYAAAACATERTMTATHPMSGTRTVVVAPGGHVCVEPEIEHLEQTCDRGAYWLSMTYDVRTGTIASSPPDIARLDGETWIRAAAP